MITQTRNIVTVSEGIEAEAEFGARKQDMPGLFAILRKGIYSEPEETVLREYAVNAVDANISNGKGDVPIEITMPNTLDPNLKIRDSGPGLSQKDMFEIFASYGYSTKKKDQTTTGCLGIGCKSAFCMSDVFTVVSYFEGFRTTYICRLDNTGNGKISKIESIKSDEHTGLEIIVPVKSNDIRKYIEKAKKLFKWFKVKPIIYGNEELSSYVKNFSLKINKESGIWKLYEAQERENGSYYGARNEIICLMGNIAYKINLEHFDSYNPKHKFFMKDGIGVAIDVPLGSVSFAANRETLEYDQFTINFLHSTLESIYDEIEAEFTKELDHAPNYWEALKVYSTFNNYFSGIKPFYKGVEISGSKIHLKNNKEHNYHVYDDSSYRARSSNNIESGSLSLRETIYIDPTKDDLLFLNKHNFPQSTLRNRFFEYCRINGITRQTKSHMYIISATEDNVNDIINDPLLDGAKFIDLADVVIPVKARKARLSRVVDKSKIQVFKFNGNTSFPYSNCWDEAAINKSDKIVYITIDGFKPLNFQGVGIYNKYYNTSLPYFAERLETYNRVMGTDIVVYGIKKNVVPQPNWENFYELTTKALEELVKSGKITRHQKAIDFIDCAIDMRGFKDFEDSISKNGSFYKYYQLHKRYVDIATNHRDKLKQITRLLDVFNIQKPNMNSDHDIELLETKLYNAILKDYPLMDYLISNYKTWEAKPEEIVNYVKLIDNSRN